MQNNIHFNTFAWKKGRKWHAKAKSDKKKPDLTIFTAIFSMKTRFPDREYSCPATVPAIKKSNEALWIGVCKKLIGRTPSGKKSGSVWVC
jgi:hypothetical protein